MMNISKVSTTVRDELDIMNMFDEDFTMWGDRLDREMNELNLRSFEHRREMEAKGYVLNPHFDEGMAWWKEKHNDRPYDKYLDFDCHEFVTPEELQWYEDKCNAVSFGWTLYQRLLDDVELEEEGEMLRKEWEEKWNVEHAA